MAAAKTIRVSAQVNGRKALDSKPCATVDEAFAHLKAKIVKYGTTQEVHSVRFCAGRKTENGEFIIAADLNPAVLVLAKVFLGHNFPVSVSDHGLP